MEPSRDLTATLGVSAVSGSLRLALQSQRLGLLVIDLVAFPSCSWTLESRPRIEMYLVR